VDIIQTFYDNMASQYDKLFLDWQSATREQAVLLDRIFRQYGFGPGTRLLDCACGIGTQAIGLAALGYPVTASDISEEELAQARQRATDNGVSIRFARADFCALSDAFSETFPLIICMDNALPHMLSQEALSAALGSITDRLDRDGIFVASIRDYDALLADKPPYSPPYIHPTAEGQRVSFQTWHWEGDRYRLIQYILEDGNTLQASKFECEYRATRRSELTDLLIRLGCREVRWLFPEDSGFYQPIVVAKK
jgi:SAM-dependent methyltransferase